MVNQFFCYLLYQKRLPGTAEAGDYLNRFRAYRTQNKGLCLPDRSVTALNYFLPLKYDVKDRFFIQKAPYAGCYLQL